MSRGLPYNVKQCLEKSRDSALPAIETYNKPAIKFRSDGYIVLMVISWTSLFHAIFFRNKIKPFHRVKDSNRFEKKDGDYCYRELKECIKQTDFVKDQIAVEVQFGKYASVAFDLFVKYLLFYFGGVINLGIEVLPTNEMQKLNARRVSVVIRAFCSAQTPVQVISKVARKILYCI